jgi:hypothetical protein
LNVGPVNAKLIASWTWMDPSRESALSILFRES